jgi:hypothetical protein
MLTAIYILLAALFGFALAMILMRWRGTKDQDTASDSIARRRAIISDCGDDVIWEIGKMRPLVASKEFEEKLSKRSFLRRAVLTASAFTVAWLASRGRNVVFGSESHPAKDGLFGKDGSITTDPHQDNTPHTDDHTDGGETITGTPTQMAKAPILTAAADIWT